MHDKASITFDCMFHTQHSKKKYIFSKSFGVIVAISTHQAEASHA